MKRRLSILISLLLSLLLISCSAVEVYIDDFLGEGLNDTDLIEIDKDGYYTSKEDVALYIHTYNKLPNNFISKKEAMDLGWDPNKGNLWDVTDRMSIGGDRFGNREGLLPDGKQYYECDINYKGEYRGAERLVYSDDGTIYYTADHYKSFILLYGDD